MYLVSGANFGTIISLPLSGWLCSFDGGWPLSFYIFGVLGIIWFVFWIFLVYDSPTSHPRIDHQEKAFILASIGPQVRKNEVELIRRWIFQRKNLLLNLYLYIQLHISDKIWQTSVDAVMQTSIISTAISHKGN